MDTRSKIILSTIGVLCLGLWTAGIVFPLNKQNDLVGFSGNNAQTYLATAQSTSTAATTTEFVGDVLPHVDLQYNLGSLTKRWRNLNVGTLTASSGVIYSLTIPTAVSGTTQFTTNTSFTGTSTALVTIEDGAGTDLAVFDTSYPEVKFKVNGSIPTLVGLTATSNGYGWSLAGTPVIFNSSTPVAAFLYGSMKVSSTAQTDALTISPDGSNIQLSSNSDPIQFVIGATTLATLKATGVSLATATNTAAITIASSTAIHDIRLYNSVDMTGNDEYVSMGWNSNVFNITSVANGSGTSRSLGMKTDDGSGFNLNDNAGMQFVGTASGFYIFSNAADNAGFQLRSHIVATAATGFSVIDNSFGTDMSGSSGQQRLFSASTSLNETGTANFDLIYGNVLLNTSGSGTLNLLNVAVNDVSKFSVNTSGTVQFAGRMRGGRGADVASAATTTLGNDGNFFVVTGTTNMNCMVTTGWTAGSRVTLQFNGILTLADAASGCGGYSDAPFNVSAAYVTTASDTLSVLYDGASWVEVGRSVN